MIYSLLNHLGVSLRTLAVRLQRGLMVIGSLLALQVFTPAAIAHSSYTWAVTRQDSSRPDPVVDGVCGTAEYLAAWRLNLLYAPRFNWPRAQIKLLSTSRDLYVCIQNLPLTVSGPGSFLSIAFDVDHTGGALAGRSHLLFNLYEDGHSEVLRGDGAGGFVAAPDILGWSASQRSFFLEWTAELRIPLSVLGGGAAGSLIGFEVRHNWLRSVGDDFTWPPDARYNVPNTWGDLVWFGTPAVTPSVGLDQVQISQGLVADHSARVDCDFVAGKDSVVRAQLYSWGALRSVTGFTVQVQRLLPSLGPIQTVTGAPLGSGRLNAGPFGVYVGSGNVQAWIPGNLVSTPGEYRFSATVNVSGSSSPQFLDFGTRIFRPSGDLRIVLAPANDRTIHDFTPWGPALLGNVLPVLRDLHRMYPLRNGIRQVSFEPTAPRSSDGGLRFFLLPVFECSATDSDCDRRTRAFANDNLSRLNALNRRLDFFVPLVRPRELFDRSGVLAGSTGTGGGQAQFSWNPPSSWVGFDADLLGSTAVVLGQEFGHCLGLVGSTSPNRNPINPSHSLHPTVALTDGFPALNLLTHADVVSPHSLLFPTFDPATDRGNNTFLEGVEWNELRARLVTRATLQPAGSRAQKLALPSLKSDGKPLFYFVGGIDTQDVISVDYTQRISDLPLDLTPEDPQSPFALRFLDKAGGSLSELHFAVDSLATVHGDDPPPEVSGLVLTASLPDGTRRVELQKSGKILFAQDFSETAPVVSQVFAKDSGKGVIELNWQATDSDSSELTHNVFYLSQVDGIRMLVASGLQQPHYSLATDLIPATTQGTLIVETSDGLNTGEATSNPFTVADKPPVAAITAPAPKAELVAGQKITLSGAAYDVTAGVLSGEQLQ